jgi:hypothetical protein
MAVALLYRYQNRVDGKRPRQLVTAEMNWRCNDFTAMDQTGHFECVGQNPEKIAPQMTNSCGGRTRRQYKWRDVMAEREPTDVELTVQLRPWPRYWRKH